jgi:hypothetical protein
MVFEMKRFFALLSSPTLLSISREGSSILFSRSDHARKVRFMVKKLNYCVLFLFNSSECFYQFASTTYFELVGALRPCPLGAYYGQEACYALNDGEFLTL